tara:strand:- start:44 stop:190 length:147 start_codon:yes stop_codon:yes gene_type:complete
MKKIKIPRELYRLVKGKKAVKPYNGTAMSKEERIIELHKKYFTHIGIA